MASRILVIVLNSYREAVRARLLHGLFALSIITAAYAAIVGEFASRNTLRVVSDLGAASISVYGVVVAVVLGATSLYRELELKTIFPILARPIRRSEYLVGKYLGIVFTLLVFIAANSAVLLLALAVMAGRSLLQTLGLLIAVVAVTILAAWRVPRIRTLLPAVAALVLLLCAWVWSAGVPLHRQVVWVSGVLTLLEVGIVAAIAMLFSAFTSPFLTAICTFGVFIVGRSADTLAHLPARVFGETIQRMGDTLSGVVPNLMLYVPNRPVLTGETHEVVLNQYLALAGIHALAWSVGLLIVASVIFRKRDFL